MKLQSLGLILVFAVLALSAGTAAGYELPPGVVSWNSGRPLTWNDFRGPAPVNVASLTDAAAIHMTISWPYQYNVQCGTSPELVTATSIAVFNFMDPSRSWAYAPRMTAETLRHEQTHFNLNEVYRRKLENALCGLLPIPQTTKDALRQLLHRTADPILDRMLAVQSQYDRETDHGNSAVAQAEWDRKVLSWLTTPSLAP
ncbi:MAG: DUF922 domain-containing protein [Candidatus Bipolaricaulis sp.]|nr:DUF922 domain-containing protein [Candidatus Bipolaricaulis sp.]